MSTSEKSTQAKTLVMGLFMSTMAIGRRIRIYLTERVWTPSTIA